jgi:hypothetical protein
MVLSRYIFFCLFLSFFLINNSISASIDETKKKIDESLFFPYKLKKSKKISEISFFVDADGMPGSFNVLDNGVPKEITSECLLAIHKASPLPLSNQAMTYSCRNALSVVHGDKNYERKSKLFMKRMQKTITSNWRPVKSLHGYLIGTEFKIAKDGRIYDIAIVKSSHNPEYDLIAKRAIEMSSPLYNIDPDIFVNGKDYVDAHMTFDYNVYTKSPSTLSKVNFGLLMLNTIMGLN